MDCLDNLELAIVPLHAVLEMSNCQVVCADNGALLVRRSAEMSTRSQPSAVIPAELVTVSAGTAVSRSSNQPGICHMSMVHKGFQPGALASLSDGRAAPLHCHTSTTLCERVPAAQVIMSSTLWHCSLPNNSSRMRRAWMPQFSAEPVRSRSSGTPLALAVPLERHLRHTAQGC